MPVERTTITYTSHRQPTEDITIEMLRGGINRMGASIKNLATMKAPILTGALRESGRIEHPDDDTVTIVFGSESVPYARRRHYENFKNPHTKYYLQKAGEEITRQGLEQFLQ